MDPGARTGVVPKEGLRCGGGARPISPGAVSGIFPTLAAASAVGGPAIRKCSAVRPTQPSPAPKCGDNYALNPP